MRRTRFGVFFLLLFFVVSSARAGDYASGFGFGITVPDVYLVLTAEEVSKNADLFLGEDSDDAYGGIPSSLRR